MPGYKIWYGYKAVPFLKQVQEAPLDSDHLFSDVSFGESGERVEKLTRALGRLGWINEVRSVYDESLAKIIYNMLRYGTEYMAD